MSRMYIGIVLLLFLLVAGILLAFVFDFIHTPLSDTLYAAAEAALADDWPKATALMTQASEEWDKLRHFTATLADHEPLEQTDALFARLRVLSAARERVDFAAACVELAQQATALAQSQALTWWSFL